MAGHGRHPRRDGQLLGFDLVAHRADGVHAGADKGDARVVQRGGETGVFRQEAVARMHRFRAGFLYRAQDVIGDKVALRARRRTDQHRLVGHLDMQRAGIGFGINGDRLDPHTGCGAHDAAGDFASVGNQDLGEQCGPRFGCVSGEKDRQVRPVSSVTAARDGGARSGGYSGFQ